MIVDQFSRWIALEGMMGYSSKNAIDTITRWCNRNGGFVNLDLIQYVRSDAGTQFKSEEFMAFCELHTIRCELAAPKHQEQNSICEGNWKRVKYMGNRLLIHAGLSHHFQYFARLYAITILNCMPTQGLVKEHKKVTTPYELVHKCKPSLQKFHTFGCPVVFKRETIPRQGATSIQRGMRGTFIGFPPNQAGYLIYLEKPLQGQGHYMTSQDVAFDDNLDSSLVQNKHVFRGGMQVRSLGEGHVESITPPQREERTGNMTQIGNRTIADVIQNGDLENEVQEEMPPLEEYYSSGDEDFYGEYQDNDDKDDNEHFFADFPSDTVPFDEDVPPIQEDPVEASIQNTTYTEILDKLDLESEVKYYEDTTNRRTRRQRVTTKRYRPQELHLIMSVENSMTHETITDSIAQAIDKDITPFLPEPKNERDLRKVDNDVKRRWVAAIKKEVLNLIENKTFKKGTLTTADKPIPTMIVFKAKVTSKGLLDKLKARIVARGDLMKREEEDTWSGCVSSKTVKCFLVDAASHNRPVKQLDFIGAFLQALARGRFWIQLPKEYAKYLPELAHYFDKPQLLNKTIYGMIYASKYWNHDLTTYLVTDLGFSQSVYDSSLFVKRYGETDYLKLIIHTDDALYYGSTDKIEEEFVYQLKKRFNLEDQGYAHWYLSHRIYREKDGSYIMDQEQYTKHLLKKFFPEDAPWGAPVFRDTPAPLDYVFTKENRPDENEKKEIEDRYPDLKLSSIVCSLLYLALATRPDILWIVGKLSKSCQMPSLKDYQAAFWSLGYLRKFTGYGLKIYSNAQDSPIYKICTENKIEFKSLMAMTDSSFQDCPDTGRSTIAYKIFYKGSLVDQNSSVPVPVAMSSAEAEYMGSANAATALAHHRELIYDLEYMGTKDYDIKLVHSQIPSLILTDNQATKAMSQNYKVTKKNRHIARRFHYVKQGVKTGDHEVEWIRSEDQLADDMTKTQEAAKSLPHMKRTLVEIPEYVRGFSNGKIGNR